MISHAIIVLAVCNESSARILIGEDGEYYAGDILEDASLYIADSLATGRIELCYNGAWEAICKDTWSSENAAVACSQLGFSRAGEQVTNILSSKLNARF